MRGGGRGLSLQPMTTAGDRIQKCWAHAHQCRARADLSRNKKAKVEFVKLAEEWETLAIEIAAIERSKAFVATVRG
jgi:hypothetical protein